MEIKIGVVNMHKELTCTVRDKDKLETFLRDISVAISEQSSMIWFEDDSGRRVGVPADKLAYVEVESDRERRVGFARS
ncbi:MAG: DUF3107 domain-containing protein [Acidimicrobiia bacterium]